MTTLRSLTIGVLVVLLSALALACASEDDPQQRQSAVQLEQQDVQREQQQGQQPGQQQGQQSDDRQQQMVRVQSGGSDQQMQGDQQQDAEQTDAEQTQTAAAPTSSEQQPDQQAEHEQGQQQAEQRDQQQALQQGESQQDERQPSVEQAQSDPPESQQEAQPEAQQQEQASQPAEPRQRDQLTLRAEEILARATAPELTGLNGWLNGEETSISLELAKGNVVLIDFWTYTCINCVRTLPFLTAWDAKYRDHGLVILGVHTPEFEFEKLPANINAAIAEHGIEYDVPI